MPVRKEWGVITANPTLLSTLVSGAAKLLPQRKVVVRTIHSNTLPQNFNRTSAPVCRGKCTLHKKFASPTKNQVWKSAELQVTPKDLRLKQTISSVPKEMVVDKKVQATTMALMQAIRALLHPKQIVPLKENNHQTTRTIVRPKK